jgi:putative membrane protein
MLYLWAKTLHIVAVVAWFAGLFYLPRLFVYHAEALGGPEPARGVLHAQFTRMERILERAIMRPALVLAIAAAVVMLAARPGMLVARGCTRSSPWWGAWCSTTAGASGSRRAWPPARRR